MSLVINTNLASLDAQRNLWVTGQDLSVAMQRLSSGLRINSAKDDAAGYAIAGTMTSQINGIGQAVNNSNNANSMVQTMLGAIDQVQSALQRMNELAVEAADQTSASSTTALDNEYQQLMDEINSIADQTKFNGNTVLNGSGETIGSVGTSLTVGNGIADITGVGATATEYSLSVTSTGAPSGEVAVTVAVTWSTNKTQTLYVTPPSGFNTSTLDFTDLGIDVTVNSSLSTATSIASNNTFTVSGGQYVFQIGAEQGQTLTMSEVDMEANSIDSSILNGTGLTSTSNASSAITAVGDALSWVEQQAGTLGAYSDRLDAQVSNLQDVSENTSAARSQVVDADFAAETAQMTKDMVLQQAGISVLAQANQEPQMILKLLQ